LTLTCFVELIIDKRLPLSRPIALQVPSAKDHDTLNSSDDGKEVRIGHKQPQNGRFGSCLTRLGIGAAMVRKTLQKIVECNLENRLERHNILGRLDARLRKFSSLGCALLRESGKVGLCVMGMT
jgi:hypothetical protein